MALDDRMRSRIPDELYSSFTMNGLCAVEYRYVDDSTDEIQAQINSNFTEETFARYLKMARKRERNYYGETDAWLYRALRKYSIARKEACIFGSANPWYEAVALEFGASRCRVFEYSDRRSFDPRISYMKPGNLSVAGCEIALSVSSFEHDGLGRYGDPIDPDGDIRAMREARRIVKKGGLLFLSVPVGKDKICFNVHRVYGKHRLPLLLGDWKVADSFGFKDRDLDRDDNGADGTPYQPVFVLRNE